jgi:predicted MFS family arabinose efflux permease
VSAVVERIVPARLGRSYRWLLASSWTTNLGDGLAFAAGPLLVASLTGSAFLVALAALLRWAPSLVFALLAGVLSDRADRRVLIMVADGARAVVLVVLAVTMLAGGVGVAVALVALGLLATAEVFADNAALTLTPMLVRRDDLAVANARILGGLVTLNNLVGPPIGAALFAAGRTWPFATQAVLVATGVLLVSRIVLPPPERDPAQTSGWQDMVEGLRWVLHHAAVRTLAVTILTFNVTYGAAWSVLVLYATRRLGLAAVGFGLVSTTIAAGGLTGTLSYGWITRRVSLGNMMRAGVVLETFTHLGLALTTSPWVAGVIFFLFGAHAFIWGTTSITIRQRAVPLSLQGRVNAVNAISTYGGLTAGAAIGGVLASHYGVTAPFWFAFAGSAVLVAALWRQLTHVAHADETDPAQATSDGPRSTAD